MALYLKNESIGIDFSYSERAKRALHLGDTARRPLHQSNTDTHTDRDTRDTFLPNRLIVLSVIMLCTYRIVYNIYIYL